MYKIGFAGIIAFTLSLLDTNTVLYWLEWFRLAFPLMFITVLLFYQNGKQRNEHKEERKEWAESQRLEREKWEKCRRDEQRQWGETLEAIQKSNRYTIESILKKTEDLTKLYMETIHGSQRTKS